jgi:hypothetical protein
VAQATPQAYHVRLDSYSRCRRLTVVTGGRDEACLARMKVGIGHMGPKWVARTTTTATGEYLVQWRGPNGGGANGTHVVPVPEPADGEIGNSLRRCRCGHRGHER